MKLSELNYVFKTKIELDKDTFIELREATSLELKDFGEDNSKNMEILKKLFPACIIDHNIENDDGTKASNLEVSKLIEQSGSLYLDVIAQWQSDIPFGKRTVKKSVK